MFWLLFFLATAIALAYARARLFVVAAVGGAALLFFGLFGGAPLLFVALLLAWIAVMVPLNIEPLRQEWITRLALNSARRHLPQLSSADRVELAAGGLGWEAELLGGQPEWPRMQAEAAVHLSPDEQDFLRGPVDTLCRLCEAHVAHHPTRADGPLDDEAWTFLRRQRFFGLRIPTRYGGRQLSATALSAALTRIASSPGGAAAATIVAAPNAFGPADVLLALGTEAQRAEWLPQLADGSLIGCLVLDDAAGTLASQRVGDEEVAGLRIQIAAEQVPLAPVAGLVAIAVKLAGSGPQGTGVVLLRADTPGLRIGSRTRSLAPGLPTGPVHADDLFVPLDALVGGLAALPQGDALIAEGRLARRVLTQPAIAAGHALFSVLLAGAQLRLRHSGGRPLTDRESVREALATAAAQAYAVDALRLAGARALDRSALSGVAAAIVKTQCSALASEAVGTALALSGSRALVDDGRDSVAGRWRALPLAARDGADLLLRAQAICGPGALRVHPYWGPELEAVADPVLARALEKFDALLWPHLGQLAANAARALLWGLSAGTLALAPGGAGRRNRQRISRYSAALALTLDVVLLRLGGDIRVHEGLSLKLADALAALYRAETAIRKWETEQRPAEDWPIVDWICAAAFREVETALAGAIRRIDSRLLRWALRAHIFPVGGTARGPVPRQASSIAAGLMAPGGTRTRMLATCFAPRSGSSPLGNLERALENWLLAEPLQRKLDAGLPPSPLPRTPARQTADGLRLGVLDADEADRLRVAQLERDAALATDAPA